MAILLFEKGKGEVVTAPVIQGEMGGGRVQISGSHDGGGGQRPGPAAARRLAGRADGDHRGAHHRPEPGRGKHRQGLQQRDLGLPGAIVAFMCAYYMLFGVFSSIALAVNLLLLWPSCPCCRPR
jgi:preprotein translocase subunit SecD